MNKLIYILMLFVSLTGFAQRQNLQGHVQAGATPVSGVFVINKTSGTETKTDATGNFSILAQENDIVVVYGEKTELEEFIVTQAAFKNTPYIMEVKPKAFELEEVVINDSVPAVPGLPRAEPKYTVAERRVSAATGTYTLDEGVMVNMDAIVNRISGKTKNLKKALQTERKEAAIQKINDSELQDQIEKNLGIPAEYVQGFLYYIVEDSEFLASLKSKNTDTSRMLLVGLAEKYRSLIKSK